MNSTSKFNVGDKVRILNVGAILYGRDWLENGDIRKVTRIDRDGDIRVGIAEKVSGEFMIGRSEFHAIEIVEETPKLTKSRRIDALEKDVARQETEIAELKEAVEALKKPKTHADMLSEAFKALESQQLPKSLTPNQRRAQIIADAKQFVEQTILEARDYDGDISVPPYSCSHIKFEVNAEKRTVVALAIGYETGSVVQKAIAKCAPDDVFNADIGKAITVGRLFDKDVERFTNAPKPDKKAVGQLIKIQGNQSIYINTVISGERGIYHGIDNAKQPIAILDDTEAQYV